MIDIRLNILDYYPQDLTVSRKLTPCKWYKGELCPTMYDPQTLQPADPTYVVICDDGKMRKVDAKYFATLEDWRGKQIGKILSDQ